VDQTLYAASEPTWSEGVTCRSACVISTSILFKGSHVNILAGIVVGILAGWLAERITGRDHGLLTNLTVGAST